MKLVVRFTRPNGTVCYNFDAARLAEDLARATVYTKCSLDRALLDGETGGMSQSRMEILSLERAASDARRHREGQS